MVNKNKYIIIEKCNSDNNIIALLTQLCMVAYDTPDGK